MRLKRKYINDVAMRAQDKIETSSIDDANEMALQVLVGSTINNTCTRSDEAGYSNTTKI